MRRPRRYFPGFVTRLGAGIAPVCPANDPLGVLVGTCEASGGPEPSPGDVGVRGPLVPGLPAHGKRGFDPRCGRRSGQRELRAGKDQYRVLPQPGPAIRRFLVADHFGHSADAPRRTDRLDPRATRARAIYGLAESRGQQPETLQPITPQIPAHPPAVQPAVPPVEANVPRDSLAVAGRSQVVAAYAPGPALAPPTVPGVDQSMPVTSVPEKVPPLALDGFCPVQLTEKSLWTPGIRPGAPSIAAARTCSSGPRAAPLPGRSRPLRPGLFRRRRGVGRR